MASPYSCSICGGKYFLQSLYTCDHGHLFCKLCFKEEYYRGKEKRCPHKHCNSWITQIGHSTDHAKNDIDVRRKKMFPFSWELSGRKQAELNVPSLYSPQGSTESVISLSKKPVYCPYPNCNKSVAVSAFDDHFKYEHNLVDAFKNEFDERRELQFEPDNIKYDERSCIALISIQDSNQNLINYPHTSKTKLSSGTTVVKPTMIVMAARVGSFQGNEDDDIDEDDFSECDSFDFTPNDKVVLWVASNVQTKYRFTLGVSTLTKNIRLKYAGPIAPVNYDHFKICNEGRGLILTQNHIRGMTLNGTKPLALDILIHDEPNAREYLEGQ